MNEVSELLSELVRIDSVNPDLVADAAGETKIARFVESWFERNGFETHWLEANKGRPTIVGIAKGRGGGRSLMFNGHLDTVAVANYEGDPFDPIVKDGKLYGRGSNDMKGGVAAMLVAAKRAKALGLRGDIIVGCVADEEYGSVGSEELVRHFTADAAIVAEPTNLKITVAHKGYVWVDILVHGRAAHGARPELGIDAITKAGKLLAVLDDFSARPLDVHPVLGKGSLHAGLISGGEGLSTYPSCCLIRLERRTVPPENADSVKYELENIIADLKEKDRDFHADVNIRFERHAFECNQEERILKVIKSVTATVLGEEAPTNFTPGWTDCAILDQAGIPCLLFGAVGAGSHAKVEYADLESVEQVSEVFFRVASEFCA